MTSQYYGGGVKRHFPRESKTSARGIASDNGVFSKIALSSD
jgi:hypothetical protein